MNNDPQPNLKPETFIEELTAAILAERKERNINADAMCSLDLRYDNSYIGGLLADDDISEALMMATKCPLTIKNYMKPVSDDFSKSSKLYRHYEGAFDTTVKAKVVQFGNVTVAFLLTPVDTRGTKIKRMTKEELSDIDVTHMLHTKELDQLQLGNALVKHDYFYIPVFTCINYGNTTDHQTSTLQYEISEDKVAADGYASKVPAGKTLWQAIKEDLAKDFGYATDDWHNNWFAIESIKSYDSTYNKKDQLMDRMLVEIEVAKRFDTGKLKPAGMHCHWSEFASVPRTQTE